MKIFPSFLRKGLILLCALILLFAYKISAQTTITISPGPNWTDVCLLKSNQPDRQFYANTNYANYANIAANAWTASGHAFFRRSLIKFDLSAIPTGATITSATLYLYSDPAHSGTVDADGNSTLSGSNAIYIEKVTANWNETSVTWNNQPASTAVGRIWFPASTSTTENIQIDIKSFVENWVNNPTTNYGMKMKLENELHYRSRNYASEDHSNPNIRPKLVITYSSPPSGDPVADEINHIFAQLDKSQVPTGFLEEYSGGFIPLDVFNGVLSDSNRLNMDAWRLAYAALYSSSIFGTNPLPTLANVNSTIKNEADNSSVIPIVMAYSNYSRIRKDAFNQNLLELESEQVKDVPGRGQSPYVQEPFFIASPTLNYSKGDTVSLVFKSALFYNTTGKSVQSLQVDFADGEGYVAAFWNTPISVSYASTGLKLIKIKVVFTDNTAVECYSQIEVKGIVGSGVTTLNYPSFSPLPPVPFEPNAVHSGGNVFIAYGNNNDGILDKPLIVVEGYDVSTISTELAEPYDYSDFIGSIKTSDFVLYNELDLAGYDLVFINYRNGVDDIRRNAALFEEVLQWVNTNKTSNAEDNVVLGISMGGLVARYGLAKITKENQDTQTRLLITHDSPHRGANVPLGMQHILNTFHPLIIQGIRYLDIFPILGDALDMYEAPATRQMLIYRVNMYSREVENNTFIDNIYQPMITFPEHSPPPYRVVATSQGSECGKKLFEPHTRIIDMDGDFYLSNLPWIWRIEYEMNAEVNALPEQGSAKRIMYIDLKKTNRYVWFITKSTRVVLKDFKAPIDALPIDGAPGGIYPLNIEIENDGTIVDNKFGPFFKLGINAFVIDKFSFVPTYSALDVSPSVGALETSYVAGISPQYPSGLQNFIAQEKEGTSTYNIQHTAFTARNAEWLFNEMEAVPNNTLNCSVECAPEGITLSGSSAICGEDQTYTISGVPAGQAVTWTMSPGLAYVSGQNTNNYTVRRVGSSTGPFWVEATLSGPCQVAFRKNIAVVIPDGDVIFYGETNPCTNEYYWYDVFTPNEFNVINYIWSLPHGWTLADEVFISDNFVSIEVGTGSKMYENEIIWVEIVTDCGSNSYPYVVQTRSCGTEYSSVTVHPNPATDFFEVAQSPASGGADSIAKERSEVFLAGQSEKESGIVAIKLYNSRQEEVVSMPFTAPATRVDTKGLPDGHYILHIISKEGIHRRHLYIKKNHANFSQ